MFKILILKELEYMLVRELEDLQQSKINVELILKKEIAEYLLCLFQWEFVICQQEI